MSRSLPSLMQQLTSSADRWWSWQPFSWTFHCALPPPMALVGWEALVAPAPITDWWRGLSIIQLRPLSLIGGVGWDHMTGIPLSPSVTGNNSHLAYLPSWSQHFILSKVFGGIGLFFSHGFHGNHPISHFYKIHAIVIWVSPKLWVP